MFRRGKGSEVGSGPAADAAGGVPAPTRVGQPLAGTSARRGLWPRWAAGAPALPALETRVPPGDGAKAAGQRRGEELGWAAGRAGRRWGLRDVGGRREGLDPDKAIFCHEKENCAFAPWIIYMYAFPPAVTGE